MKNKSWEIPHKSASSLGKKESNWGLIREGSLGEVNRGREGQPLGPTWLGKPGGVRYPWRPTNCYRGDDMDEVDS